MHNVRNITKLARELTKTNIVCST